MKNLKGKKLLILAGADVHTKVVKAAKDLGVYTIVTDNLQPEDSPAKKEADEYWMYNIFDIENIVAKSKEKDIDGVLAFCIDPAQTPYQKIAEELKVPCYASKENFETFTNKSKFREFCKKNSVSTVPSYSIEDLETGNAKFPVLVKPSESRGSRGQTVCISFENIKEAIEKAKKESKDGKYLIERYMEDAQDMSFSYVIINGEAYLLKIGDRYLGNKEDNLDRQHIATILPSVHLNEYQKKVEPRVKAMIKNTGIKFGAVFLQGFWKNGEVYFYDPGLRFPGGDFDIALKMATEYDNMKTFVNFALTGETDRSFGNPLKAYNLNNHKCIILSLCAKPGKISGIKGFEELKNDSRIVSASLRYKEGETVPDSGDIRQRVAEFVALLPNEENEISDFIYFIYSSIKVVDDKGSEMLISKLENL